MKMEELARKKEEFEQAKQEEKKVYEDFKIKINNSLMALDNYEKKDYLKLMNDIINDYNCVFEFDKTINSLNKTAEQISVRKASLLSNDFNLDDFLEDKMPIIMSLYFISSVVLTGAASDALDFIKKYLILGLIAISSFKINSDFFQSKLHKEQLKRKVAELSYNEEVTKYNLDMNERYRAIFADKIDKEEHRLVELIPDRIEGEGNAAYFTRILPYSNVEFTDINENIILIEDKPKTKKKDKKNK